MKYKIVKEFKRGEPVPADAVYISSRDDYQPTYTGRISHWVDIYEVPVAEQQEETCYVTPALKRSECGPTCCTPPSKQDMTTGNFLKAMEEKFKK
jgi:hypothetical protein